MSDGTIDTIARFFGTLYQPGDVFEVRAPNVVDRPGKTYRYTVAGYYRRGEIGKAAKDVAGLDSEKRPRGIYCTLNPVNPALLGRASNCLGSQLEATTKDSDVLIRRWMLIDCDPVRPSHTSSTDSESQRAQEKARTVVESDVRPRPSSPQLRHLAGRRRDPGRCHARRDRRLWIQRRGEPRPRPRPAGHRPALPGHRPRADGLSLPGTRPATDRHRRQRGLGTPGLNRLVQSRSTPGSSW